MTGDEVRQREFREAFRGYNPKQVDELLAKIADALDASAPISALLGSVEFGHSIRGYRMEDVDAVLDRLRLQS